MTRVFITAASAVVRAGLEAILVSNPAFEVVGSSALLGAQGVQTLGPDVVLVELERGEDASVLPFLVSGAVTTGLPAIVVLADLSQPGAVARTLRLGVRAVLPREAQTHEIVAAVTAAASGLVVLHPESLDSFLPPVTQGRSSDVPSEPLTPRETEVLTLLAEGAGNKSIARRLGISEHTVKFHVGSILAKLNASSRTEAVTLGVRQGKIMV